MEYGLVLRYGTASAGQVALNLLGTNNRFTPAFEATGRIIFTASDGEILEVTIGNADMDEPYVWTPTNSAEVAAFANHVRGLTDHNATLTLTDAPATTVPSVPAAPTVTAQSSLGISAAWIAPDDGGSPITAYNLRYKRTVDTVWITLVNVTSPSSITGLAASSEYEVQIEAVNAVGSSGYGSSGMATTPAAPALQLALSARAGLPTVAFNARAVAPPPPLQLAMTSRAGLPTAAFNLRYIAPLLTLSDWDDTGLDVEFAALLEASAPGTTGNNFYAEFVQGRLWHTYRRRVGSGSRGNSHQPCA